MVGVPAARVGLCMPEVEVALAAEPNCVSPLILRGLADESIAGTDILVVEFVVGGPHRVKQTDKQFELCSRAT